VATAPEPSNRPTNGPKEYRFPPGPSRAVPVWQLPRLRRQALEVLQQLKGDYGDLAYMKAGPYHLVFVNAPDEIKRVLVTEHQKFTKSLGMQRLKRVFGDGLLTSEGQFHRRQRKLVQPAFRKDPLKQYAGDMVHYSLRTRDAWQAGAEVDMAQEMMRLTLAIVAKTLFEADVDDEADDIGEALSTVLDAFPRLLLPFGEQLLKLPLPKNRRAHRSLTLLDDTIYGIICKRRESGDYGDDLMSMLLRTEEEGGEEMTPRQVRDEAITLFLAGHETTALALTWTWYLLSENPEPRGRLHAELDSVLGAEPPTYDDLDRLPYTRQVIKESMRLYPPAYIFGRQAITDYAIGEYLLPAGKTMVFMSPYVLHRDPQWYEAPEEFRPERWTPEFEAELPKFAYLPFGGGPRICIGASFAMVEAMLLLATLAQHWNPVLVPRQQIVPEPLVTLRPKYGMCMTLDARSPQMSNQRTQAPTATPASGCPYHD